MVVASTIWIHAAWVVPLLLLIAYLGSPRFRDEIVENQVRRLLDTGLDSRRYTVFHDLAVPSGGGTVRIDHVVVSRPGIFVIESRWLAGRISGTAVQARWRQYRFGRIRFRENPVHRNAQQVTALQRLLGLSARCFEPVVVLGGHKGFKNESPPANVVRPGSLLHKILRVSEPKLSPETAAEVVTELNDERFQPSGGIWIRPTALIRSALLIALVAGVFFAFRDDIARLKEDWRLRVERQANPEHFTPEGRRKSEREIWLDSLACAYSPDTGHCSCYEPGGNRAEIDFDICRSLAEKGTIDP